MSNPSFKNLDADEKEADVKKDFMAALKKAEEVISKPEEPAGRTRGRPSEVAPPSPKASNKRKSTAEAPATR